MKLIDISQIKRGGIWLVNLDPTVGHEIRKMRPAVIVQNDIGNTYSPITIIAPLTSQGLDRIYPIEVLIIKGKGLDMDCKVLLNQIRAVDKKRLIKKLGSVDMETIFKINEGLKISLGLVDV